MAFIETMKQRAQAQIKNIILPEATDKRILEAAIKVEKEGFAKITLIGDTVKVNEVAKENGIDISNITLVDPNKSDKYEEYVQAFFELRQKKGMTEEKA